MYGIYGDLAKLIVLAIYVCIFVVALIGVIVFWINKKRNWAFWWVSIMANIFAFLYLLGGYGNFIYVAQFFSIFIWPIINLFWLGMMVFAPKTKK